MHLLDFFPPNVHSQVPASLATQLEWKQNASMLMIDLPLRYILQAALNHLQQADDHQVLIVTTESKDTLQEYLFHEQHLYTPQGPSDSQKPFPSDHNPPETATSQGRISDPWRHLFPSSARDLGRGVDEEFSTATQLTQDTYTPGPSATSNRELGSDAERPIGRNSPSSSSPDPFPSHKPQLPFQPDLWARIQLRYAPSLEHVHSFFQCLHLDADTMQGKTLGDDSSITGCVAPPTLVMLVGCFQDGEIFGSEADGGKYDEGEQVEYRGSAEGRSDEASRLCVLSKGIQMGPGPAGSTGAPYPEETHAAIDQEEQEDRIRLEYLRLAGQTMSEVKDGLEWIERKSGRKPRLMVFEESSSVDRKLWLEKVIGYWTDSLVAVEAWLRGDDGHAEDREEEKDSIRMWLKTHARPGQRVLLGSVAEEGTEPLGVEWRYDGEFSFRVIN